VKVECRCVNSRGAALRNIQWYSPAKHSLNVKSSTIPGNPYSYLIGNKRVAVLIVPNFTDTYNGKYTCETSDTVDNRVVMAIIDCT